MADISDIEQSLVSFIAGVIYPTGTGNPSAIGAPARIYRGWPNAASLDTDIAAGAVNISVFSDPGMSRLTSRYPAETIQIGTAVPTIVASVSGASVTLSGAITAGNVVGVQFGAPSAAYATAVIAGDTLTTIAARLGALIPGSSSVGAVLTLPSVNAVSARTMAPQTVSTETRRQDQGFRISCWCNTPTQRDRVAGLIDNAISGMRDINGNLTRFIALPNGESGWIRALRTYTDDKPTKANLWRRDLCYMVEYPTTLIELDPISLFIGGPLWGNDALHQWGAVEPSTEILTSGDFTVLVDAAGNLVGSEPTL